MNLEEVDAVAIAAAVGEGKVSAVAKLKHAGGVLVGALNKVGGGLRKKF